LLVTSIAKHTVKASAPAEKLFLVSDRNTVIITSRDHFYFFVDQTFHTLGLEIGLLVAVA
jgi:hypothetical protein